MEVNSLLKKIITFMMIIISVTALFSYNGILISTSKSPLNFDVIKNLSDFYINVDSLSQIEGVSVNKTSYVVYVMKDMNILDISLKDYYSKINFIDRYPNTVIVKEGKIYIKDEVISYFLNMSYYKEKENIFFYKKLPVIKEIMYSTNELKITFDTYIEDKMVDYVNVSGRNIISVKPVANLIKIPNGINYIYSDGRIDIDFISDFSYVQETQGNVYTLKISDNEEKNSVNDSKVSENNNEIPGKTDDVFYKTNIFNINGRDIKTYSFVADPNFFKVKVETNNLGIYSKVSDYIETKKPVLSVNASFFDPSTLEPIGNIVEDSGLVHLSSYSRPAFIISSSGIPDIRYLKLEYKVELSGNLFWIKAINSFWKGDVKLYTSHFKGNISEKTDDYLFYLIKDGMIIQQGYKMPKDDELLLLVSKNYEKYLTELKIGDTAEFVLDKNIDYNIYQLVEGGPILLSDEFDEEMIKEEKRAYQNGVIYGKSSRTIVAIDNENMVTFILAEGLNSENEGPNYDECAEILKKLGDYKKAIMFDGGGSSFMYYKGDMVNKRSEDRQTIPVVINVYSKE